MDAGRATETSGAGEGAGYFVSNRVLRDGRVEPLALWVEGGVIVRFDDVTVARRSDAVLADFGDAPLVPAWANGHVHLAMAPLRGIGDALARAGNLVEDVFFRLERHLTGPDVRAFARIGALENVLSGVGEVWDHYYFANEVAEALVDVGLPGTVASTFQDRGGPFGELSERALEETRALARDSRFARAGVRVALGPHASDTVSDEGLERIEETSRQLGLPVHLHLAQSLAEYRRHRASTTGDGSLAARVLRRLRGVPVLFAHGLFLDRAALQELAQSGAVLAYCPASQLQFGFLGPFGEYLELGGRVTLGTDAVASNDAHSLQRELLFASGYGNLRASFGPSRRLWLLGETDGRADVLDGERSDAAGFQGARTSALLALGFGDALSALDGRPRGMRLGAEASFQILDPDAPELFPEGDLPRRLAFGDTKSALRGMVLRGRLMSKLGALRENLLGRAYQEWLREARARRRELLSRAGLEHFS